MFSTRQNAVASVGFSSTAQPADSQSVVPFKIQVPNAVLTDLKQRLSRVRFAEDFGRRIAAGAAAVAAGRYDLVNNPAGQGAGVTVCTLHTLPAGQAVGEGSGGGGLACATGTGISYGGGGSVTTLGGGGSGTATPLGRGEGLDCAPSTTTAI